MNNQDAKGREPYSEEQYESWLNELRPFLLLGNSLYYAMDKALLTKHKDSIYRKFRLNDWFCEKIEAYQRYPGEIVNSIFTRVVNSADEKVRRGEVLNDEEWRNLRFFAEKHRSCQPFFVSRNETSQANEKKFEEITTLLHIDSGNYDEFSGTKNEHHEETEDSTKGISNQSGQ